MAEQASIFMALRVGANFNGKKWQKDMQKFKEKPIEQEESITDDNNSFNSLDFFKKRVTPSQKSTDKKEKQSKDNSNGKKKENASDAKSSISKSQQKKQKKQPQKEVIEDNTISLFKKNQKEEASDNEDETEEHVMTGEEKHIREVVSQFRHSHKIKVEGTDIPDPIETFDELVSKYNMKPTLLKAITESGYQNPTPIQMQVLTAMLREREVLGIAPTGSGKTMAFAIPILASLKAPAKTGFRAVIVSPTRELATQIYREFLKLTTHTNQKGWRVCLLTKSTANSHNFSADSSHRFDILVTTPMRLVHLVQEDVIKLNATQWLIFDEADKLFDEKFIEQIDNIIAACASPSLKVCLFSATMMPVIEQTARTVQKNPIKIVIGKKNTATDTIDQRLLFVGSEEGKVIAIRSLIAEGKFTPPVLIFVQSKERATQLFHELIYDGINVDVIHAERTQAQRNATVDKFRTGEIWVLITTELMARGIDFKNVRLVINYDFPQSITSYIHRIGRTGRAGRSGDAITFYSEADFPQLRSIANVMKESGCQNVPEWIFKNIPKLKKDERKRLEKRPVERPDIEKRSNKHSKRPTNNNKNEQKAQPKRQKTEQSESSSQSPSESKTNNFNRKDGKIDK